jgi:hypothetical protein
MKKFYEISRVLFVILCTIAILYNSWWCLFISDYPAGNLVIWWIIFTFVISGILMSGILLLNNRIEDSRYID